MRAIYLADKENLLLFKVYNEHNRRNFLVDMYKEKKKELLNRKIGT